MNAPWDGGSRLERLRARMLDSPQWLGDLIAHLDTLLPCGANGGDGRFCTDVTKAQCERWLNNLCGRLLFDCTERFEQENALMHEVDCAPEVRQRFSQHLEDHGDLMEQLVEAIQTPTPCTTRLHLRDLLHDGLAGHLGSFDAELLEWLREAAGQGSNRGGKATPDAAGETSTAPERAADFSGRAASCAP